MLHVISSNVNFKIDVDIMTVDETLGERMTVDNMLVGKMAVD